MLNTLSVNEAALALGLDSILDDYGVESLADICIRNFSEDTSKAVVSLCVLAFNQWGALAQPEGADWEVAVYALDNDLESSILICVRHERGPLIQLSSLTVDADKELTDDLESRTGPKVILDVLYGVLAIANRLLNECEFVVKEPSASDSEDIVLAETSGNSGV
jgi:hypothetical protein